MPQLDYAAWSRGLALVLRHRPPPGMRDDGFVLVDEARAHIYRHPSEAQIARIVATSSKKRFELKEIQGQKWIRAVQGHSLPVQGVLHLMHFAEIPAVAAHGTQRCHLESIFELGLLPGSPRVIAQGQQREHVHMCLYDPADVRTTSGVRKNTEVLVWIDTPAMGTRSFQGSTAQIHSLH